MGIRSGDSKQQWLSEWTPLLNSDDQFAALQEEYSPEEIESAQMALAMFSKNFNKGTQGVSYLKEFEKTTNKFLINE